MVKTFEVTSLRGIGNYSLKFNSDLNILTGKNGSGKTTLLKLIWYMLSPNLERIFPEIDFCTAKLITDDFTVSIEKKDVKDEEELTVDFKDTKNNCLHMEFLVTELSAPNRLNEIEKINRKIMDLRTSSVFFPTFRRIEGGFSLDPKGLRSSRVSRRQNALIEAMTDYSQIMSVDGHQFVTSISTADIEDLLTKQFASVSDSTNALHIKLSQFITKQIGQKEKPERKTNLTDKNKLRKANKLIEAIREQLNEVEADRESLMKPFTVLTSLISTIFKDKGIRISSNLTFGETKEAIQASILSAGEKQMLSFLCYNAFTRSAPIFIDEPELSLHVDWQRILFSTLKDQGTNNQFIVSTHSPFIYSKYPEKEIVLDTDRGGD